MQASPDERVADWVRDHGPALRGYLLALVRRPHDVDDLLQEVFARAWEHRHRYQEQGYARAYLLRIADRLACDRVRRRRPERSLDGGAGDESEDDELAIADRGPDPAARAELGEATRRLHAALDALSSAQQRVLLLRYFGQLSFQEIADTLECPLNTALSHCQRGLAALRKRLGDQHP